MHWSIRYRGYRALVNRSASMPLLALALCTAATAANAQQGTPETAFTDVQTGAAPRLTASLQKLKTGEQAIVADANGKSNFAGQEIELSNFSGVFGISSDTAYILIADGRASHGNLSAKPGEVLILTPYGGAPVKQTFDASRFLATWSPENAARHPIVMAAFEKIQSKQKRAIFLGLYRETSFNVAAPGSSSSELARRTIVGSKVIQDIRFSSESEPEAVERLVVSAFRDALINGDVEAVASLMDPTPYGGMDLRGGAGGARLLKARQLIQSKNWRALLALAQPTPVAGGNLWQLSAGKNRFSIQLRPVGDFTYISSIAQGV